MNIYIGSDHGGFILKQHIIQYLQSQGHTVLDVCCPNGDRCDYPDSASVVCKKIQQDTQGLGILLCGTGIGISIAANKYNGIRCALCNEVFSAEMAKKHNNANIIALGSRIIDECMAIQIMNIFLTSTFEGGRHQNRLDKITRIEENRKEH